MKVSQYYTKKLSKFWGNRSVIKSLDVQVSASYVSSLSSRLDNTVNDFLERKIDGEYKFIYIDGTYLKIRNNGSC